jgi:hypothetical protein
VFILPVGWILLFFQEYRTADANFIITRNAVMRCPRIAILAEMGKKDENELGMLTGLGVNITRHLAGVTRCAVDYFNQVIHFGRTTSYSLLRSEPALFG